MVPSCGDEESIGDHLHCTVSDGLDEGNSLKSSIIGEGFSKPDDEGLEFCEICPSDNDVSLSGEMLELHDEKSPIHFGEVESIKPIFF